MGTDNPDKRSMRPMWVTGIITAVLLAILTGVLVFANLQLSRAFPGGVDFLYRWLPARSVLFEGNEDVYSEETSIQTQIFRYGRPAEGGERPCLFAYPFYAIGFFLPFALIEDFSLARAAWMTFLELAHFLIVILSFKTLQVQPKKTTLTFFLLFSILFSFLTQSLGNGNPASISVLFVTLSLYFIAKEKDWPAGICLAIATIKPQMVILVFGIIWLWAFSKKRWTLILSSAITLGALFGASFLIQPHWFSGFLRQIAIYQVEASPHTPEAVLNLLMPALARPISYALIILSIGILGLTAKRTYGQNPAFLFWGASVGYAVLPLIGIGSADVTIGLLPGLIFIAARLIKQSTGNTPWVNAAIIGAIIASWWVRTLNTGMPEYLMLFIYTFPLAVLTLIALFWIRPRALAGEAAPGLTAV